MAKRKKARRSKSRRSSRARARKSSRAGKGTCCPIISVKCKAGAPGAPKSCVVKVGSSKARRMNSVTAGKFIGRTVRAQTKRRCRPLVKGSTV